MNQPKLDPEIEKRFDEFLSKDFDHPKNRETHRWLFCWDGEESIDLPFDCACCFGLEQIEGCGCICHKRINHIKAFLAQEIARERDRLIKDMTTPDMKKLEKEYPVLIRHLASKMDDNSPSNVNQEKDNVTSVERISEKTRPTGEDYNKLEDGGIY